MITPYFSKVTFYITFWLFAISSTQGAALSNSEIASNSFHPDAYYRDFCSSIFKESLENSLDQSELKFDKKEILDYMDSCEKEFYQWTRNHHLCDAYLNEINFEFSADRKDKIIKSENIIEKTNQFINDFFSNENNNIISFSVYFSVFCRDNFNCPELERKVNSFIKKNSLNFFDILDQQNNLSGVVANELLNNQLKACVKTSLKNTADRVEEFQNNIIHCNSREQKSVSYFVEQSNKYTEQLFNKIELGDSLFLEKMLLFLIETNHLLIFEVNLFKKYVHDKYGNVFGNEYNLEKICIKVLTSKKISSRYGVKECKKIIEKKRNFSRAMGARGRSNLLTKMLANKLADVPQHSSYYYTRAKSIGEIIYGNPFLYVTQGRWQDIFDKKKNGEVYKSSIKRTNALEENNKKEKELNDSWRETKENK